MPERSGTPERVLIFRTGSLGDTAFNLPVFHHLNRLWPRAEKRVLTNFPVAAEAPPLQAVLGDGAFAQGYFEYPGGTRRIGNVLSLARAVRRWNPDIAVYMNECRGIAATLRDGLFLMLCGARRVYGLPLTAEARGHRVDAVTGLHEREVSRIARARSIPAARRAAIRRSIPANSPPRGRCWRTGRGATGSSASAPAPSRPPRTGPIRTGRPR